MDARPIYQYKRRSSLLYSKRREELWYEDRKEVLEMPAGACLVMNAYSK
jgi:hypothetical protein